MPQFDPRNYVDVQTRISRFWSEYPDGAIRTVLASPPEDFERCRYRAEVYKSAANAYPDAVGYAFEVAGGRGPNATSHEENCETSAVGRALANMGYATSGKDRPSRQEMTKANAAPQPEPARTRPVERSTAPPAREMAKQGSDTTQRETDAPGPNTDAEWQRASRRLHAVAKQHGIKHEQLSDYAAGRLGMSSLSKLAPEALDDIAQKIEHERGFVVFLNKHYPPVADDATQPALTDADLETITGTPGNDRWSQ